MSMLGVLLLTFGLMSTVMLGHFMDRVKKEECNLLKSKLYTVVTDIENQLGFMKEITAEITYLQAFKWRHIQSNKYNELEAISQLKDFVRFSDIWERCFVKYPDYGNVIMSDSQTTPIEIYLSSLFEETAKEKLALIEQLYTSENQECMVCSNGKTNLFLFSTKKFDEMNHRRIVVGFEVSEYSMEKRIKEIVGELGGTFKIVYDGNLIYEENNIVFPDKEALEFSSYDGKIKMHYIRDSHSYFSWKNIFSYREMLVFAGIGLLMLCLTFLLSVWNYKPVRQIAAKYSDVSGNGIEGNTTECDLERIDRLIDSLLKSKEKDSKVLQAQYKALKEQIAYMIVSGYNVEKLKNHMILLNIDYEDSTFGIVECDVTDDGKIDKMGDLMVAIEELSGEGVLLYPCYQKELKILVIVEDENQLNVAIDLLDSLFETMEISVSPKLSAKSYDLEVWMSAEVSLEKKEPQEGKKTSRTARQVIEYVEHHFMEYDLSLDSVAEKFMLNTAYLSRIIKQELGMGYKEYLMELRMNRAKEMLLDQTVSVADVCAEIGYANPSHFIKLFQKYTGMTPAKYRDESGMQDV